MADEKSLEKPLISIESVTKSYAGAIAVDNVSFEVRRGEIVGFVGPNGAGKSTMLKMLSTFIPPTKGRITVAGIDAVKDPLAVRRRIGYLAGDTPLYQDMRVDRFIHFVGRTRGLEGARLSEAFGRTVEQLELKSVLLKRVKQCSTGFRQRIGLAAAMIHDPEVILLDEPTHGFDPLQVMRFRDFLKGFKQGRAILFSDHIIQDVSSLCDRVVIINRGRLLAAGTLPELSEQAGHPKGGLEGVFAAFVQRANEAEGIS